MSREFGGITVDDPTSDGASANTRRILHTNISFSRKPDYR